MSNSFDMYQYPAGEGSLDGTGYTGAWTGAQGSVGLEQLDQRDLVSNLHDV